MVTVDTLRQIALSFPETTEQPHFEKTSFRTGKKIFATVDVKNNQASVKLSAIDQDVFSSFDKTVMFPVSNKWGKQGWTIIKLDKISEDMLRDALKTAWCEVAPKKLSAPVKWKDDE